MKEIIKKLIEAETGIEDISVKSRKRHIVEARVVFTTLCLRHTKDSYETISKIINRDHSTVVHCRKIYNNWSQFPKHYLNNLSLLEKIDNIINEQKDKTEKEIDIVARYRKKNILLSQQIDKLTQTVVKQQKILKKYEPKITDWQYYKL